MCGSPAHPLSLGPMSTPLVLSRALEVQADYHPLLDTVCQRTESMVPEEGIDAKLEGQ